MPIGRVLLFALLASAPCGLQAQSNPTYVQFTPSAVKGALYRPDTGPAPHVGILLTHRTSNVLGQLATTELSRRGYLVLALNPRSDNNEAAVFWEELALDVKSGIEFLRKQPGITKVLLLGGSGGGPTMSFYQAVAEQGPSYCQGANKLVECGNELANLPKADGVIFRDAHPGISVNVLRQVNPAVTDDADPRAIDASLDPFSPANGYVANGPSHYSDEFRQRYFRAQSTRMNRLIAQALEKRARMRAGTYPYPDDDVFVMVKGGGPRLMEMDPAIHHTTAQPRKLLRNDGTVATQIVENVRPVVRDAAMYNTRFDTGTLLLTVRSFLSTNAIRSTDAMDDIDWCSSNNSTMCALRVITVPILLATMQAHYFMRDNELLYEAAVSKDKDLIVVEGATHGITPCKECETTPGQYSNSVRNFFDYVKTWIDARF